MSIKVAQKWFHWKNDRFWQPNKNWLRMWEIWANSLLPNALKTCPKSNKSPNLVTLVGMIKWQLEFMNELASSLQYRNVYWKSVHHLHPIAVEIILLLFMIQHERVRTCDDDDEWKWSDRSRVSCCLSMLTVYALSRNSQGQFDFLSELFEGGGLIQSIIST